MKSMKKILIVFLILYLLCSCCNGAMPNYNKPIFDLEESNILPQGEVARCCDSVMYPVYLNGEFSFINISGEIVTKSKYKAARCMSEGLYAVCIDDKWGFIDNCENEVIPCKYEYVGDFSDGLAAVKNHKKYGFIDLKGTLTINYEFDDVSNFSEGYAYVVRNSPYGEYINKSGESVFYTELLYGSEFSEGIAILSSNLGSSTYQRYIDLYGKIVLENYLNGTSCGLYKDGLAFFPVLKEGDIKYIYIDKNGDNYFGNYFDYAESFSENLAVVVENGTRGVINNYGEFIYYNDCVYGQYSEGYVTYCEEIDGINKYGFLDINGDISIAAQYDNILKEFTNDLALVELDENLMYIDNKGNVIYKFEKPDYKFWV